VTSTVPIVMTGAGDPIRGGLVASLARTPTRLRPNGFKCSRSYFLSFLDRLSSGRSPGRFSSGEGVTRTGIEVTFILARNSADLEIASKVLAQEHPDALIAGPQR